MGLTGPVLTGKKKADKIVGKGTHSRPKTQWSIITNIKDGQSIHILKVWVGI
jgi:hypothetical protein